MKLKTLLLCFSLMLGGGEAIAQYCAASGPNSCSSCAGGGAGCADQLNMWIIDVEVGTINNTATGCEASSGSGFGYSNFTDQFTVFAPGTNYDATVTLGGAFDPLNVVSIYVDLNDNGLFTDPGEEFPLATGGGQTYTGTLVMPQTLPDAVVGMRVRTAYQTISPCGTRTYGEVEDYSAHLNQLQCATTADAGTDATICDGESTTLNGSGTGDNPPVTYSWAPTTGLSDPNIANPVATPSATTTYTLTVTDDNGNGCTATDDVVVTVNPTPAKPDITFTANDPVCEPDVVTLTSDAADTYQWKKDGVDIASATAMTYDVTETGDYSVVVANSDGCTAESDPVTITIFPEFIPNLVSPNPTVCSPDSSLLYIDNYQSGFTVEWYKDGVVIPNESNDSLYVHASGDYDVLTMYAGGECPRASNTISVDIVGTLPQPVISPVGPGAFCSNDPNPSPMVTLEADLSGLDYQWFKDGVLINGATNQTHTTGTTGSYVVEVTSTSCTATSDPYIVSTSTPAQPTITALSANPKCPEDSVLLESSLASAYEWLRNGVSIPNEDGRVIAAVEIGLYKVIGFNEEGCSDTSFSFEVKNFVGSSQLIIAPDGPTVFCEGDSVRLFAQGATDYQWFVDGNPIAGANNDSYLALSSGEYHVTYSDGNSCAREADPITVTVNAGPPKPTISAPNGATVCFPDSVLLQANGGPYAAYQWLLDGDTIVGKTADQLYVQEGGAYQVRVANADGCTNVSNNFFVTVRLSKKPRISFPGGSALCQGDDARLTSNYNSGNQWYKDGAAISGATNKNYTVSQDGFYHVIVTDGPCSRSSDTIQFQFGGGPAKPDITPNSDTLICNGESVTFSTTATENKTWFKDGVQIPNEHGSSVTVSEGGFYFVEIADANNCTAFSDTIEVIKPFDGPVITRPSSDTTICDNSFITLSTNSTESHEWFYNGSSMGLFTPTITVNQAGTYRAIVTSGRCQEVSNQITISHLPAPNTNPTITVNGPTIFCEGQGSTELVAGSTGGLHYEWVRDGEPFGAPANQSITVSEAGEYQVVVYNALGCTDSSQSTAILNFPKPRITNVIVNESTCPGANDATVTIEVTGGGGSISYSFDGSPYGFSSFFDGVAPGFYFAYVLDNNGCTDSVEVIVGEAASDLFVYTVLDNNITCNNDNNGQITATGTGGDGPLEYSINGGATWTTDEVFSGLSGGTYNVIVRDTNGCMYTSTPDIVISNPEFMDMFVSIDNDITCKDDNNGSITASTVGGTGFKKFRLNNGPWIQAGNTYTWSNLSEGTYVVRSMDERGCLRTSIDLFITNPSELKVDRVFIDSKISCNGADDGVIEAQVSGGGGTYEYSLNPPNFQTSNKFTDLGPGAHVVTVRDARGCQVTAAPVFLTQPTRINVSATVVQHADCFGGRTGRIAVAGSGGTGELAFSIDGNVYMLADTIDGVRAGDYTIYAMDENGCIGQTVNQVTVSQGANIQVVTNLTHVSCFDAFDGAISINASGGNGTLEYAIGSTFFQSSNTFTGLQGGTYEVSVRDARGCVVKRTVTINEPTELKFETSVVNVRCFGQDDGQIIALASGGTPPYSYSYNNGGTFVSNPVKTSVGPGVYTVLVRDAAGCVSSAQAIVQQPNAPLVIGFTKQDVSCNSAQDGEIRISSSGGTGNRMFSLDNGAYQADSVYTDLNPGFYIIHVRDENFCVESKIVVIDQPDVLDANLTITNNINCSGENNAVLTASATGGTTPYRYTLDPNLPYTTNDVFRNLGTGTYRVYIKDANGCTDSSATVTIANPQPITISANLNQGISCFGANDAVISVNASGGSGFLSYSINGGPLQGFPNFTNLGSGNYIVTVFDANNCSRSSNVISISEPQQLLLSGGVDRNVTCFNGADGRIVLSATGGTPPLQYSINGQDYQSSPNFNGVSARTYTPRVVDANGCVTVLSSSLTVSEPTEIIITGVITDEFAGNDGAIDVTVSGGAFPYRYEWNSGQFTTQDLVNVEGNATYTLKVIDNKGCEKTAVFFVPTHVGIEELAEKGGLSLYPNPNNGAFSLRIEENSGLSTFNWTLMNVLGDEIESGIKQVPVSGTVYDFDFSGLPKGVYHMILTDDEARTDLKLVIQ